MKVEMKVKKYGTVSSKEPEEDSKLVEKRKVAIGWDEPILAPDPRVYKTTPSWVDTALSTGSQETTFNGPVNFTGDVNFKNSPTPVVCYNSIRMHVEEHYGTGTFYPTFSLSPNEVVIGQSTDIARTEYGAINSIATVYTVGVPVCAMTKAIENEITYATSSISYELKQTQEQVKKLQEELALATARLKITENVVKENGLEDKLSVALVTDSIDSELKM